MKLKILISLIWVLFSFFGCGKTTDESTADAILSAQIKLSENNCQGAIDGLESHGRENHNIYYLKTLAAAYACRAGYNTVNFFSNDFTKTATPNPLGGMTTYSTSVTSFQVPFELDPQFVDMMTAINILLYAGNIVSTTEPTALERAKYFSSADLGDLHTELMYMELVTLGMYMKLYSNASAAGVKGAAVALGNKCFTSYGNTINAIQTAISFFPGACKVINSPHAELSTAISAAARKRRLCHGVVLLNGIFDILPSIMASATGNVSNVGGSATTVITNAKAALTLALPTIGTVLTTVNQNICEDNNNVPVAEIESYFALMFESIIL